MRARGFLRRQSEPSKSKPFNLGLRDERKEVDREEIERAFAEAGWHIDGGFSDYLIIGYDGNGLSILAYEQAGGTDEPIFFELIDHERDVTYGVQEIPPPQQAARLLVERGQPPEEED
jgi:hypothetical protein